jgi:hypothetical protein
MRARCASERNPIITQVLNRPLLPQHLSADLRYWVSKVFFKSQSNARKPVSSINPSYGWNTIGSFKTRGTSQSILDAIDIIAVSIYF